MDRLAHAPDNRVFVHGFIDKDSGVEPLQTQSRERYGVKSRAGMEPGAPVVAEDARRLPERFEVTRDEIVAIVDEALRARGVLA